MTMDYLPFSPVGVPEACASRAELFVAGRWPEFNIFFHSPRAGDPSPDNPSWGNETITYFWFMAKLSGSLEV